MTDGLAHRALADTLAYLAALARDGVRPPDALNGLGSLRQQHPGLLVDLVWEESAYPATIHYDALLRAPGGDTVSLSLCPASDTPWPLRGVRLASDQDLVRVNGETLKVRDAMECIDFIWNEARIIRPLIELCIIDDMAKRWSVEPTPEHTQRALDAFRSSRGLLSAAQMLTWMETNGVMHAQLERLVEGQARAFALRDRVAADAGLESYWANHPGEFDIAHIARIRVRNRDAAERLAAEFRTGRDFYMVAEEEFAARRLMAMPRGSLESVRRRELLPADADAIFSAAPGEVAGPLDAETGLDLVRVIRTEIVSLDDDATQDAVSAAIFEEWLAEQRRSAHIEWYWGPTG